MYHHNPMSQKGYNRSLHLLHSPTPATRKLPLLERNRSLPHNHNLTLPVRSQPRLGHNSLHR